MTNNVKRNPSDINVLIACEESQEVCKAFRKRGFHAFSCDVIEPSGGHPEYHILGDALEAVNGGTVTTMDGVNHYIGKWDLLIAHPPCTYLCMSGQQHCNVEKYGEKAKERMKLREEAVSFFMNFINADCERIAVENPVGIMTSRYKKATQYIQPCWFGHPHHKKTGLWLKGLKPLTKTNVVDVEYITSGTGRRWEKWFWDTSCISNRIEKSKARSKTPHGIAEAMAEQWGNQLLEELKAGENQ